MFLFCPVWLLLLTNPCPSVSTELTQEEAYDIFKKCVKEIQKRLVVNLPNFRVAVVDKNGVRYLDEITKESLGSYNPSA